MDHAPIATPPAARSRPIWQRPVSRRTVLATGAAGATAAALAALWKGNDLSQVLDRVRDYTHGYQGVPTGLGTPSGWDWLWVPDKNGTKFAVVFVARVGRGTGSDAKLLYLLRQPPTWPTNDL